MQFYSYTANFNVKFLTTLATVLEANLKETISHPDGTSDDDATDGTLKITESLLPTLRVYSMWIAASREELFAQAAATAEGSLVSNMMDTFARVFTMMCVETYNRENLISCPYLLPEDLDVLGFQPLSENAVPEACRSFCDPNGKVKPHLHSPQQQLQSTNERLARILDILRCAYFLAEEPSVPLSCRVVNDWLLFEYHPAGVCQVQSDEQREASVSRQESTAAPATINVQKRRSVQTNNNTHEQQNNPSLPNVQPPEIAAERPPVSPLPPAPANNAGEVGDAENTVINMLAPFLKPPTPQPQQSAQEQATPSSCEAPRSSTQDFLSAQFSQLDASPRRSIPSGKFEPLPWEWFNTPKPARGENSPLSASGMSPITPGLSSGKFDDPFLGPSTPIRADSRSGFPRVNSLGNMHAADMGINLSGGSTAEHAHRTALLHTFNTAAGRPPSSNARMSPFSQWVDNPGAGNRQQQHQQQIGMSVPPGLHLLETTPHSSSAGSLSQFSQFSHPSSIYQGTPVAAVASYSIGGGGGLGATYGGAYKDYHLQQQTPQPQQRQQQQPSMQRLFQADNTASSYDEAILRAAYDRK